jgi:hypothetical protein
VDEENWRSMYDTFHGSELSGGIRSWNLGTGDLVATKTYDRTSPGTGVTERTRLELWHTPLG